jgi:hypothetical protein
LLAGLAALQIATIRSWKSVSFSGKPPPQQVDVLHYVTAQIRDLAPSLVLVTWDARPSPPVFDWLLVSQGDLPVTASDNAMHPGVEARIRHRLHDERLPEDLRTSARRVLDRYNSPAMTRTLHLDRETATGFEAVLEARIEEDPPHGIIALIGTADSVRYPLEFVEPGIVGGGYRQVSVREFPRAATRVYVYRRP